MKRNYTSLMDALEHYMKKFGVEKREDLLKLFENFNQATRIRKPKYIFLNTLVTSKKQLLEKLKADSYEKIRVEKDVTKVDKESSVAADHIKTVTAQLKTNQFVKDEHIKYMYIFSADSNLNKTHDLFVQGHMLQVDKSSCLAPLALSPDANSHAIDAASAPGNKTILLATIMKNTGLIHAFDIGLFEQRLQSTAPTLI